MSPIMNGLTLRLPSMDPPLHAEEALRQEPASSTRAGATPAVQHGHLEEGEWVLYTSAVYYKRQYWRLFVK